MIGVAAASASKQAILVAGVAGLVAGAMSMAVGEYVSVSSQRDAEQADIGREKQELTKEPQAELQELAMIYEKRGAVKTTFSMAENHADILNLLRKYADQPMSLADACLVRMAELNDNCQIFTTDRDFLVYRRKGRGVIPLLAPF